MQSSVQMESSSHEHSSSQFQSSSKAQSSSLTKVESSSSEQEVLAAAASRGLVRQNTFTKDSIKGSSEPKARPVATDESNARLITSASKGAPWNQDSVRLVGGRIVRSRGEGAQMSPGATR